MQLACFTIATKCLSYPSACSASVLENWIVGDPGSMWNPTSKKWNRRWVFFWLMAYKTCHGVEKNNPQAGYYSSGIQIHFHSWLCWSKWCQVLLSRYGRTFLLTLEDDMFALSGSH